MKPHPKVVICGSFRKDIAGLKKLFLELETNGCRVLAPLNLNFDDPGSEYLKLESELQLSVTELEKYYLRAISECDLIWLHAPDGYVGVSGAFELGFAYKSHKAVFSKSAPTDPMLQSFVTVQSSVFEALWNSSSQ